MAKANNDENVFGMLSHLLAIFTGFIAPLIFFLVRKDQKGVAYENAKHSLNFQITIAIFAGALIVLWLIFSMLSLFLIGIPLLIAYSFILPMLIPVIGIVIIIFCIIASVQAYEGKVYIYPLEIKFFK